MSTTSWYVAPSNFWGRLSDGSRAGLSAQGSVVRFRKGIPIFRAGSSGDHVYILTEGRVKVYALSPLGRAVILWFCLPGEMFGLAEMARGGERVVYAEACTDVEALVIPRERFRGFLEGDISVAMLVVDMLSCRLRGLTDTVLNLIADDVTTRVVKLLLRLDQRYGVPLDDGSRRLDIPLTHQEMADMTGTTRQSVSSVINELKQQGLLTVSDHRISLRDDRCLETLLNTNAQPSSGDLARPATTAVR
ncbi:MAG: Crp/Fnr family transcriptional regulator [Pseudomonadota bacterium]